MVVAEFSVTPVVGDELRPYIDAAVEEVRKSGLKYEVDAMGTTMEGDLSKILDVVIKAHHAVKAKGANRVLTEIKIDDRTADISIEEEVGEYRAAV